MLRRLAALSAIVTLLAAPSLAAAQTNEDPEPADPARSDETAVAAAPTLDADVATEIVVHPAGFSATVTVSYEFTNSTPLTQAAFFERLPPGATVTEVVMGDSPATTNADLSEAGFVSVAVVFDTPLAPSETLEGRLTYTVVYPGNVSGLSHVSPGLIAIAPYARAHGSGAAALTVRIPEAFELIAGRGWDITTADGFTVLNAVSPDPYAPLRLVAENPDSLVRQAVPVPELDIVLATLLPGSQAVGRISRAARALTELTGLASARPIEIRHGWPGESPIRIVEDPAVPAAVVLPDAAAEVYAAVIATELLATIDFADEELLVDTAWAVAATAVAGQAASDEPSTLSPAAETGRWLEPLSEALAQIESPAEVFAGLVSADISYPGTAYGDRRGPVDWRWMLDVLENQGSAQAAAGFAADAGPGVAAQISQRAEARADYLELEQLADGWSLPLYLRVPLAEWRFTDYLSRRGAVQELLQARDELDDAAAAAGLEVGPHLRLAFETAETGMAEPLRLLDEQRHALDVVAEAQTLATTDRGLLAGIGLVDYDADAALTEILELWEAGEFSEAEHAAHSLIETYEGAVGRGTLRAAVPLIALGAAALLARWLWQRRPRRTTG